MKWKVAIIVGALVLPLGVQADVYVKRETHTDGYYAGGRMNPADDAAVEMWIGDGRMAYVTDNLKCIIDTEKNRAIVVNRRENTYVETPLPLEMSRLFSEEDLETLNVYKRTGTVKKTGKSKQIEKWNCSAYETHDWIDFEGGRVSEKIARSWVTRDVPFDLKKYDAMFANMRKLANLGDVYLEQISAIDGFEVSGEETTYNESVAVKAVTKVVEMAKKKPAPGAYAVPDGCTKKDTLTLQDLRD